MLKKLTKRIKKLLINSKFPNNTGPRALGIIIEVRKFIAIIIILDESFEKYCN
tara:strand:- start:153 stop:311 length:159 start_codon:yes stop_codon:yes gene_type:complete